MIINKDIYTKIFIPLAAAMGYGGWAVFANYEHGPHAWAMAGAIQATYAFISTFFITTVAQRTYIKYNCGVRGVFAGFITSFIVMLAIPVTVHCIAGTPDILQTILPGLIWGSIYLMGFLITLNKVKSSNNQCQR